MRRLLRFLLPAIVLVPVITIGSAASATLPNPPACAGVYDLDVWTSQGLPDAVLSGYISFDMTLATGQCTGSAYGNHLTGWLSGTCGAATGYGSFSNDEWFYVAWTGTALVLTTVDSTQARGKFEITPPAVCPDSGAASFQAVGTVGPKAGGCLWLSSVMSVSPAITYTTSTWFVFSIGGCVHGYMTGSCLAATGTGTVAWNGASFDVVWAGNDLTFTGNLLGKARVFEVPVAGNSCTTGAYSFLATGAAYGLG